MSLRASPVTMTATLPDGRVVTVRVGVPNDPYIPKSQLDTVTVELEWNREHLAAVNTILDHDDVREARELAQEIVAGLDAGTLEPTAGAIERLAETMAAA